jgi:anti-sigma regulatory factor (Ser/Thr protein kinase)
VLNKERIDLCELARDMQHSFSSRAQKRGLALELDLPQQPVLIYVDRDKIAQVFTNLLSNAFKFTEQGSVTLQIRDCGTAIECAVMDTGRGIAPEDHSRLFNRYEQVGKQLLSVEGEKGTGLGLAICRGLVELHRGSIHVDSAVGKGTRFYFKLPVLSRSEVVNETISQEVRAAKAQGRPLSVLVFQLHDSAYAQIHHRPTEILDGLVEQTQGTLRRKLDRVLHDDQRLLVLLPETDSMEARQVLERLQIHLHASLAQLGPSLEYYLRSRLVSFPENSDDAVFLQKALASFGAESGR